MAGQERQEQDKDNNMAIGTLINLKICKINKFCSKYKIAKNIEKYLKLAYTSRNAVKTTKTSLKILSNIWNTSIIKEKRSEFINDIENAFGSPKRAKCYEFAKNNVVPITDIDLSSFNTKVYTPAYPQMELHLIQYLDLCQRKLGLVFTGPFIKEIATGMFEDLKAYNLIAAN